MAQTGYTPIQIYSSSTPTNAPSAGNLTNDTKGSELAINIADKNLFFKDSTNSVNTVPIRQSGAASDGWLSSTNWNTFNNKQAALVSGTNIKTVNGTTLLGSGDLGTIGVGYGGTGTSTAFTAGSVVFAGTSGVYSQDNANLFWDDTNNRLGISTTSPSSKLDIDAGSQIPIQTTTTQLTTQAFYCTDDTASGMNINYYKVGGSPAASDSVALLRFYGEDSALNSQEYGRITTLATDVTSGSEDSELRFSTVAAGTISSAMRLIDTTQALIPAVYASTTASAANVFVASSGLLSRSTSSIQYKTDVEDLAQPNSANIYNMRPVWYRSTCAGDNKNWSWYGLIAEEVAQLDPRLVHWGYADDQYDITYTENDGQKEEVKTLKDDAVLQPEGVQYDRLTVLLIQEMKALKAEVESLKAEVQVLKGS